MKTIFLFFRMLWDRMDSQNDGLVKSGHFRVIYKKDEISRPLKYNYAKDLAEIFGGKVVWIPH